MAKTSKYGKMMGFRASETEKAIIEDFKKANDLKTNAEALKAIVNEYEKLKKEHEKPQPSNGKKSSQLGSLLPFGKGILGLPTKETPAWLKREINLFLAGNHSPYIAYLCSLKPNEPISPLAILYEAQKSYEVQPKT